MWVLSFASGSVGYCGNRNGFGTPSRLPPRVPGLYGLAPAWQTLSATNGF